MDTNFRTEKLQKIFNSDKDLQKKYNKFMVRKIKMRLAVMRSADTLAMVPTNRPVRRHLLKGKRSGQYAVDLVHPFRLVFEPNHDPIPGKEDGGIDERQITAVTIIEVVDYH